jgi:uncharacterized protein (DUF1697 family)
MSKSTNPVRYVALLRGINVAGKNLLLMKDLAGVFHDAGCSAVNTYIQSGNVLFTADAAVETTLPVKISSLIEKDFGHRVPVVLRTLAELRAAVAANPFLVPGVDQRALHVYFLGDRPAQDLVAALDPGRSPPDRFAVLGREVYLHLPDGMARTKLTNAWLDSKLKTVSTARNWNTLLKLVELMQL